MASTPSPRIARYVAALPLAPGLHVLEIGCGPGVAARLIASMLTTGRIVAIDRSPKAIALARAAAADDPASARLEFRIAAVEAFSPAPGDEKFDLAFAMRVGALDGRHPELEAAALARIKAALRPEGLLFIDDKPPVRGRDLAGLP